MSDQLKFEASGLHTKTHSELLALASSSQTPDAVDPMYLKVGYVPIIMEVPLAMNEPMVTFAPTSESGILLATPEPNISEPVDPSSDQQVETKKDETESDHKAEQDKKKETAKENDEKEEPTKKEEEEAEEEDVSEDEEDIGGRSKRERKKVERLSESLNKRYEAEQSKHEKANEAISSQLQGHGKPLGEIPLIEVSITKSKPVDLKLLHSVIYGRTGSVNEIRTNLRRFRGFSFAKNTPEYSKREQNLNKRTMNEIRNALRILNLQVTGSLSEVVTRLLEFLLAPSADVVKYKGKLIKKIRKSTSGKKKKNGDKKNALTKSSTASRKRKAPETDDDEEEVVDSESDSRSVQSEKEEEDNANVSACSGSLKKGRRQSSELSAITKSAKLSAVKKTTSAKKVKRVIESDEDDDDDDEIPLSKMKPALPTDEELKNKVIEVLKTANLQETSMKAVRTSIFEKYKNVDLSSKKQFINDAIKEYLSSSI